MNEDLSIFEQELRTRFIDVPLPEALEAGRVAEALKRPKPAVKLAPAPWKRAMRIAAAVVLVAGAAIISMLAIRQRLGNKIAESPAENTSDTFFTQSTVSGGEAGAGSEAEAGVIQAPEAPESVSAADGGLFVMATDSAGVPMPTGLDEAVSEAIITNSGLNTANERSARYSAEAHRVLGSADSESEITVYAEVVCAEYELAEGGEIKRTSGTSAAAAMTFDKLPGGYALAEYWSSGADSGPSIAEKFPEQLAGKAAEMSAAQELFAQCDESAKAYFTEGQTP